MKHELTKEEIKEILNQFKPEKSYILNALNALQQANKLNYLSHNVLNEAAKYFKLTKGQIYGIVTYYSLFSLKPRAKNIILLCKSPMCYIKGSSNLLSILNEKISQANANQTYPLFSLEQTECIGYCNEAPAIMVNNEVYTQLTSEKIDKIIELYKTQSL